MKYITGLVTAPIIFLLAAGAYIYAGGFDVAAISQDSPFERWLYSTTMQRSVAVRAENVAPPPAFTDDMVRQGFDHYDEMCTTCHGGPGLERTEIGKGLHPQAPDLTIVVKAWTPRQLFWIVKNGVKMTAMPSFGRTHTDEQIWEIIAFTEKLPGMSSEKYRKMKREGNIEAHEPTMQHEHGH